MKDSQIKKLNSISDKLMPVVALILCLFSAFIIAVAPSEAIMGDVQKILYMHVGSAMACYLMLAVTFIASVLFLVFKHAKFAMLLDAASSISFLFCGIVLITGMIWGHSSWNTWWRWEPRLTSVLILWILLFSLRYVSKVNFQSEEKGVFMSILGILSAIQVPIVMFSIKLLDRTEQLHPEVVAKQGLRDSGYVYAMISSNIAMIIVALVLLRLSYRVLQLDDARLKIKRKLF